MKKLQNKRDTWKKRLVISGCILQLLYVCPSYAGFINGGFEDTYIPSSSNTYNPITGWTLTGYTFNGNATTAAPTSINGINLSAGTTPGGITDILRGPTQTLFDWFLQGATPTPTQLLPITGLQSVMINLRSIDAPLTVSGTSAKPAGWTTIAKQATSISQQFTVQASDFDPTDGKVHIRIVGAPVLENPAHAANQQPFFAIQLNNLTTGRTGSNPLFFQWSYAAQPGVPWKTLAAGAGTNSGSNTTYNYTDLQEYDIAPGNAFIHVGDTIELIALASGCSLGGHDGHMYLDDVAPTIPPGLWVTAIGPASSTPGDNITYTYYYTNQEAVAVNNVQVVANMPQQGTPAPNPPASTTFVSVTTPTVGTSPSCSGTAPVTCNIGTLQPGQTGSFQLTVNIPSGWALSTGPVNNGNYPITGQGLNPLLGPLIQTALLAPSDLSNLVVNTSGLPTTATLSTSYSGTFSCSNTPISSATGDSPDSSCDITNLPAGLSVSGCTISPSNTVWNNPTDIPSGQTVTCSVSGTPTTSGKFTATVSSNSANNSDSTNNQANATITIASANTPIIPATLNGSGILTPAEVCCGRPVILGPLPVPGSGPTTYTVVARTGNVGCFIGHSELQTYLKMDGSRGSCTIIAMKNGIISAPLKLLTP